VYEAMQESPERRVALKVMALGVGSTGAADRLREEAQILALSHPGVAHVYEAGVHEAAGARLPWLALEYVEGGADLIGYARARPRHACASCADGAGVRRRASRPRAGHPARRGAATRQAPLSIFKACGSLGLGADGDFPDRA
jgi:hypothetical protein